MMETDQLFQFEHGFLYTSRCHVFCAHKRYLPHLIPIQNHCLADKKRCIWIWKKDADQNWYQLFNVAIRFRGFNNDCDLLLIHTYRSLCAYDFRLFTFAASDGQFDSWAAIVAASKLCDFLWYGDELSVAFIWLAAPKPWFVILKTIKFNFISAINGFFLVIFPSKSLLLWELVIICCFSFFFQNHQILSTYFGWIQLFVVAYWKFCSKMHDIRLTVAMRHVPCAIECGAIQTYQPYLMRC